MGKYCVFYLLKVNVSVLMDLEEVIALLTPTVTSLSDDGVCDKSEKTCEDTTLYGHYFFENMSTTCYVTRQEVLITLSIICYGHFFLAIKYFYK